MLGHAGRVGFVTVLLATVTACGQMMGQPATKKPPANGNRQQVGQQPFNLPQPAVRKTATPAPAPTGITVHPMATAMPSLTPLPPQPARPTPVPTPVPTPTVAKPTPAPTTTPIPAPTASPKAIETKMSFDLFGRHKDYSKVTARVQPGEQGKDQTLIEAVDGDNTLTLVVDGTGVGEHKMVRAELKDAQLGSSPIVLDASNPKISGTVTFDTFDPAAGKISGTFTGGYNGFPPVQVNNGILMAQLETGQTASSQVARQ